VFRQQSQTEALQSEMRTVEDLLREEEEKEKSLPANEKNQSKFTIYHYSVIRNNHSIPIAVQKFHCRS